VNARARRKALVRHLGTLGRVIIVGVAMSGLLFLIDAIEELRF
jgi:hypothetical protein